MIEERELNAAKFWQHFDDVCRVPYQGITDASYEKDCLLALFVWISREMLDLESIPLRRGDNPRAWRQWWSKTMRSLDHALGCESSDQRDEPWANWMFYQQAYKFLEEIFPSFHDEVASFFDYRFVRLVGRETGTHRHLSHFSASLVNALADPRAEFVDVGAYLPSDIKRLSNERGVSGGGPNTLFIAPRSR